MSLSSRPAFLHEIIQPVLLMPASPRGRPEKGERGYCLTHTSVCVPSVEVRVLPLRVKVMRVPPVDGSRRVTLLPSTVYWVVAALVLLGMVIAAVPLESRAILLPSDIL